MSPQTEQIGTVLALYLISAAIPGPNIVLIMQTAASQTRAAAVSAAFGVTSGVFLLASAAVSGLTVLLTAAPGLMPVLQFLGAAYLILLGVHMWRQAKTSLLSVSMSNPVGTRSAYRRGVANVMTNPQTVLFFASILTPAIPNGSSLFTRLTLVAGVVVTALFWFSGLAYFLTSRIGVVQRMRSRPLLERVLSVGMVLFGVQLLFA